jgi:hypothetical protein
MTDMQPRETINDGKTMTIGIDSLHQLTANPLILFHNISVVIV